MFIGKGLSKVGEAVVLIGIVASILSLIYDEYQTYSTNNNLFFTIIPIGIVLALVAGILGVNKQDLKLFDRVFKCDLVIDRDLNASINIKKMGLAKVGSVRSEYSPEEIATSRLHGIYPYNQMSVYKSGSSGALAEK